MMINNQHKSIVRNHFIILTMNASFSRFVFGALTTFPADASYLCQQDISDANLWDFRSRHAEKPCSQAVRDRRF